MSWHFSLSAIGKTEARHKLKQQQAYERNNVIQHCPDQVFDAVALLIDVLPDHSTVPPIVITSYGHRDDNRGGNLMIEVRFAAGAA